MFGHRKRLPFSCDINTIETSFPWRFLHCPLLTRKPRVTVSEHPPMATTHHTPRTALRTLTLRHSNDSGYAESDVCRHGNAFLALKLIVIYFQLAMSLTLWTYRCWNGVQL